MKGVPSTTLEPLRGRLAGHGMEVAVVMEEVVVVGMVFPRRKQMAQGLRERYCVLGIWDSMQSDPRNLLLLLRTTICFNLLIVLGPDGIHPSGPTITHNVIFIFSDYKLYSLFLGESVCTCFKYKIIHI